MSFLSNEAIRTYGSKFTVEGTQKLSENEIKSLSKVEMVNTDYGLRFCFFYKTGGVKYVKPDRDCGLTEGQIVDPNSVSITKLSQEGLNPIYRASGSVKE